MRLKSYLNTVNEYCKNIVNSKNFDEYLDNYFKLQEFIFLLYDANIINKKQKRFFQRKMWSARHTFKAIYYNSKEFKNSKYTFC